MNCRGTAWVPFSHTVRFKTVGTQAQSAAQWDVLKDTQKPQNMCRKDAEMFLLAAQNFVFQCSFVLQTLQSYELLQGSTLHAHFCKRVFL